MSNSTRPGDADPLVDALAQLSFAVLGVLTRSAAEHDLSVTQLRLLGILRDRSPSMAQIAARLELDRSSISGLIDRAERRGLVARARSPHDARVTNVQLTAAGAEVAEGLTATVNARITQLLAGATAADRRQVLRLAALVVGG